MKVKAAILLGLALAVLILLPATAPPARSATPTSLTTIARALRENPVYVDPAARDQLSEQDAKALSDRIEDAGKPLFVAVLPADHPTAALFPNLRTATGVTGLYAIRLGTRFDARADSRVLPGTAVRNLVRSVATTTAASAQLTDFTTRALTNMSGRAPSTWSSPDGGGVSTGALVTTGGVLAAAGAGGYLLVRRTRRRKAQERQAALARLRVVVDEDITAFGEELDRLDFHPAEKGADDAMRADYERALDAYETAKSAMSAATAPDDVRPVTQALEDGRFSLAQLAARREGRPLPERRPPCFFDPRHGPSTTDATWTPLGGAPRQVPVCAADATRLADGRDPVVREVDSDYGRRPYWEAGPAYGPWAGGYFGGGLLPGLLAGTMLGGLLSTPSYASDHGPPTQQGYDGGDFSGADFNPGDFGGGFGDGGDLGGGGGDFGGDF